MIPAKFLLDAYRSGVFPMGMEDGEIGWFSPDPRGILPLDAFHVPHGLRRRLKNHRFEIRVDQAFEAVMRACGKREETWINEEILESYCNLQRLGFAHSVETWLDGELVGGLYGVTLGKAFFGESMFHTVTDASKIALHALMQRLVAGNFSLLDIQWTTPHLKTFGAIDIPRSAYRRKLAAALIGDPGDFFALDSESLA